MDRSEVLSAATKIRRATSNRDMLLVCDAVFELLTQGTQAKKRAPNGTFDRKSYMRNYMREVRAKKKVPE